MAHQCKMVAPQVKRLQPYGQCPEFGHSKLAPLPHFEPLTADGVRG